MAPGIDHNFLNNVETYLRYAADSNITSDGSGNWATSGYVQIANNQRFRSKDTGGTVRDLLYINTANNVILGAAGNNAVVFLSNTGVEIGRIAPSTGFQLTGATAFDGSNSTLTTGLFKLLTGSITRIQAAGPYSVTTTGTFFNHNLGVVPDFVIPVIDSVIGAAHAAAVDFATMTSTQVKLSSDLAGGLTVRILSFKF